MPTDDHPDDRCDASRERRWANYFEVGYNALEVLLHFGQFYALNGEVHWHTRIVTHPAYAGELLRTLRESLEQYERAYPAGKGGEMPNEVTYKVTLQVKDGPKLDLNNTMKVDAYDKVEFELRPGKCQRVDLQPTNASASVHFLLIQLKTDPKGDPIERGDVYYTVNGTVASGSKKVVLTSDHALLGKGVIELLAVAPTWLTFCNCRASAVTITCLVGRDNNQSVSTTCTDTSTPPDGGTTPPEGGGYTPGEGTTPPGGGGYTPGGGTTPPGGGGYPPGGGTTPPGGGGYPPGGGTTPPGGGGYPPGGGTTPPGGGGYTPGGGTPPPGGGGYPPGGGTTPPGGGYQGGGTPPEGGGNYPGGGTPSYPSGGSTPPPQAPPQRSR